MTVRAPERGTSEKRAPLWIFEELRSLRHRLIQRAGRFYKSPWLSDFDLERE